jgi:hypothetical protein
MTIAGETIATSDDRESVDREERRRRSRQATTTITSIVRNDDDDDNVNESTLRARQTPREQRVLRKRAEKGVPA